MIFGEKIKYLRSASSYTQKELGNKLGVSQVTVRNWETGSKFPSMQAIIDLANVFHVTSDYLLGISVEHVDDMRQSLTNSETSLLNDYRRLDSYGKKVVRTVCSLEKERVLKSTDQITKFPAYNTDRHTYNRYIPRFTSPAAAGYAVPIDGEDFEMIPVANDVPLSADFAVKIQGDSMFPYISDGDTVYVRKLRENLEVGDVGIFSVDGATYCKIYYRDENGNVTLVSANKDLSDSNVFISADSGITLECFGKVILKSRIPFPDYFSNR